MISQKFILKKSKNIKPRNELPLFVRITKSRKSVYISTGIKLTDDNWDSIDQKISKKYPNHLKANRILQNIKIKLNNIAYDYEVQSKSYSSKMIKESFLNVNKGSLIVYAEKWIQERISGRKITVGTAAKYNSVLAKIKDYSKGKLLIEEVNYNWLIQYEVYLRVKKKNGVNTISTNMSTIRAIVNDLIRDGELKADQNPFLKYEMKHEHKVIEFLNSKEIERLESLNYDKDSTIEESRLIFLFCCQTGLRIGDALHLQPDNYDGTHINYYSQKTKENLRLKLTTKAKIIIEDRINNNIKKSSFVFNFMRISEMRDALSDFEEQKRKTSLINKYLKDIAKNAAITKTLRTHIARHTAAGIGLINGLSLVEVQSILGHKSIDTTQQYTQIRDQLKDAAIDKLG